MKKIQKPRDLNVTWSIYICLIKGGAMTKQSTGIHCKIYRIYCFLNMLTIITPENCI